MGANVTDFLLGPDGRSVARSQYNDEAREWSLHLRQGSGFRENWETVAPIERPALMGLGINGDSVIVAADRPDLSQPGRPDAEFFDVNLETGAWRALRFEFSPDALFFHPVTRRLIGAMRRGDAGPVYAFIDDDASALWITVQRAFAGRPPGGGYPGITPERVAAVRPVTYPASDGLEIHGYLTTPPGMSEAGDLPLVVLVHGGPAARDYLQFDWWAQAMASRGYAVLQPNFPGSTGYGDAFLEAGYGEWGRKMQTDLSDGVRYLADQGIIDPERVCIVGASYGGYAAMAGPTLDPGVYRCAVAVAGLSDLGVFVDDAASRGARRENSTTRYWNRFMGAERLGDRSLDARSPARLADQADAPILLIHGRDDTVVPIEQSRIM
ncbi:alpha/beta fold hydrolase [Brevundimonas sp. A19_0]|uniref:alpha/beta hydrolase family protein n=1 Tax=Brevundimonas sp. A19_0 TaxID=2821087 RepID=UPI001FD843F2|nr:alpha/beta fold hydrolase [Brevundimonas sp. A19_0]